MQIFTRPKILYPTLVRGYIDGPIRCESIDGSELWLPPATGRLRIEPFLKDGKVWCVTHIQLKAKYFSLLYDPFIYHQGYRIKAQEFSQNPDGGWSTKAGTEIFPYWRTCGWRWQKPDEKSKGTPWIWSWGRGPGLHLD